MTPPRKAALTTLLILSLGAGTVQAQAPAPTSPGASRQATPAQAADQDRRRRLNLFVQLRDGVVRLEDCPPYDCGGGEPDSVATAFHIGSGYLLTAYNLIYQAKNLTARVLGGPRLPVEVIGYDDRADLALLRVTPPAHFPALPLATTRPRVGDATFSIGNGNGRSLTRKQGRVTALNVTSSRAGFASGVLGLDTQIQPGDGGGPVITTRGEVVGVMSYLQTAGGGSRRVTSYAVPVTRDSALLRDLRRGVKRDAPATGVVLRMDPSLEAVVETLPADRFVEFSDHFKLDLGKTPGVFFTDVTPGSSAARAGLRPLQFDRNGKRTSGDIITAVNGQRVVNLAELTNVIYRFQPGDTVTLTVLRGGTSLDVKVTLIGRSQVNP